MLRIVITLLLAILVAYTATAWALPEPSQAPTTIKDTLELQKTLTQPENKPEKPIQVKPEPKLDPVKDNPNNCDLTKQYVHPDFSCTDKPSEPVATVARSVTTHGVEQWRALVSQYDWDVATALRIMQCESGGNSQAIGDNYPIGGIHAPSIGLMQIRALPGRPSPDWLLIPENNISYAYDLYSRSGWQPWTCYYKI